MWERVSCIFYNSESTKLQANGQILATCSKSIWKSSVIWKRLGNRITDISDISYRETYLHNNHETQESLVSFQDFCFQDFQPKAL